MEARAVPSQMRTTLLCGNTTSKPIGRAHASLCYVFYINLGPLLGVRTQSEHAQGISGPVPASSNTTTTLGVVDIR